LRRWTRSAATSSLAGGSALRSSKMFSRGLTTLKVHRHDRPGKLRRHERIVFVGVAVHEAAGGTIGGKWLSRRWLPLRCC
jgi:hypothetical protein